MIVSQLPVPGPGPAMARRRPVSRQRLNVLRRPALRDSNCVLERRSHKIRYRQPGRGGGHCAQGTREYKGIPLPRKGIYCEEILKLKGRLVAETGNQRGRSGERRGGGGEVGLEGHLDGDQSWRLGGGQLGMRVHIVMCSNRRTDGGL